MLVLPIVLVVFWQTNTVQSGRHSIDVTEDSVGSGDRARRQPVDAASPTAVRGLVYGGKTTANKRGGFRRVSNQVIQGYFLKI